MVLKSIARTFDALNDVRRLPLVIGQYERFVLAHFLLATASQLHDAIDFVFLLLSP